MTSVARSAARILGKEGKATMMAQEHEAFSNATHVREANGVPQPGVERIEAVPGNPLVVGIAPGQPDVVVRTAAHWAKSIGGAGLVCIYVDPSHYVIEELPDGTVRHAAIDPDSDGEAWRQKSAALQAYLARTLDPLGIPWTFVYSAGRADRAITHLARAVNAPAIVVGARQPSWREKGRDFFTHALSQNLVRHQHRPVLVIPTEVVDWATEVKW